MLSPEIKIKLHRLARKTLENFVLAKQVPDFEVKDPELQEFCGAFVTLKIKKQLRGCIGLVVGDQPLWKTVRDMTVASASSDHRFVPVVKDEVPLIDIQISVMSPLKKIEDTSQVEVGKHGLVIRMGLHMGLLLPQVASENNWDRCEFLEHTCLKAGVDPRELKNCEIYVFTAEVF